ncbi:hypothetical protein [Diaphorobacter caeni]|uniref:hypothetical protein n=1 Tax=Diaphorobacter caeni TaxID=2784387 RepID=UPI00188E657B|nr:hypothetical protein [Diaphorobacter caeni]MBF5005832.1 hypothetical protein [Diaphorobacter caeni]
MPVSNQSIQHTFIQGSPKGTEDAPSTLKSKNHVLSVITNPHEAGRAKAADLAGRGTFRQNWVSRLSCIGLFTSTKLRNDLLQKSGALINQLRHDKSYIDHSDRISKDIETLKSELETLRDTSPKDYAAVSCFIEDAVATLTTDELQRFVLILEDSPETSKPDSRSALNANSRTRRALGDEAPRQLTLFRQTNIMAGPREAKVFDDNLYSILGKGIAKNVAAQVVQEAQQHPQKGMRAAYDTVADGITRKCPGLAMHVVVDAMIYDFHAQTGMKHLDENFIHGHPLKGALQSQDSFGEYTLKPGSDTLREFAADLAKQKLQGETTA